MNKYSRILFLILIGITLIFCSWYFLHQDLNFHTDIARDFLLLQEIDDKKFVLLGPRSSTGGLFHGPLWLYLNYPAFVAGGGNPIVVGWYWIILSCIFLATSFFIAKKLFTETTAWLYVLFLSGILIFETPALFNPHGAFFLLPAFFFFYIRTIQTFKLKNLIIFLFVAGCIIQFQMAIGIPLLILGTIPVSYLLIKKKKKTYFFSFFVLLIPLSTFILFDLKHQFIQLHGVLSYVLSDNFDKQTYGNIFGLLANRLQFILGDGLGIFKDGTAYKNNLAFALIAFLLFDQIKKNHYKLIYLSAIYFFVGFYVLSLINKSGGMLYHYYMPLFPLVFLIFASFITAKHKKIFLALFLFAYVVNLSQAKNAIQATDNFFGKDQNSWKFLSVMAKNAYQGQENEFGYFIYMPDALAYQPKYAISYASKRSDKTSFYFQKKPITYIIIAPPPPDKPGMKDQWWKENQLKLAVKPQSVRSYPNGYRIERYELSTKEQIIPFDPTIDTGIHFR